jgi:hypothetical protein
MLSDLVSFHHIVQSGIICESMVQETHKKQKELFNLRHSALRASVERAFGALKNRCMILYNKPFYPYKTQVKLVLDCCILHNWILRNGEDDHVPPEDNWPPNEHDEATPHDLATDNNA